MIARIRQYFVTAVAELRKVMWPPRRDVIQHTLIIAVSVMIAIILLGLADYGLTVLLKEVILNQ